MFDHECPAIGNNKLNMSKSDCVARIASGDRKCATCTSGVGYAKPAKKKPGRKRLPPKPPTVKMCACGRSEIKKHQRKCLECKTTNRIASQKAYRRKQVVAKIAFYENRLAEFRKKLKEG